MLNKILPIFERLFSLLVVFLMLSATTIWTGRFFGKDWSVMETPAKVESLVTAAPGTVHLKKLGIEDKVLVPRDSTSWNVFTSDHKSKVGVVLSSEPYSRDVIGYAGTTPVFIYLDADDEVQAIVPGDNDETPSFFKRATRKILKAWNGMSVSDALPLEVDVVSGATYSSHALIANTRNAMAAYVEAEKINTSGPVIGWVRTIALFFVFAFGIFVSFRCKGKRWWRISVLILNVGVTGFWCGQFLCVSVLRGLIENGADVLLYLPTLMMLAIAIVMPYLGKRNHYCAWMCPYGSLQELAWRLPLPKLQVNAKTFKVLSKIRIAVLMILMFLLWMGYGAFLLEYEPFSAFIVTTAAPAVIVLAAVFVVLGMFFPHPWCHCVCPVGALLNLAEEKK